MTDRYAVIGNPIEQSKSPLIHEAFAEQTGQDLRYERIRASDDGFDAALEAFRREGGLGLNVTAPFKLDAARAATVLRVPARRAGAANCLRFDGDAIEADNFDGVGLLRDVTANLHLSLRGRRVLLLGAGGAARGVLAPFLGAVPTEIVLANRTASAAERLAESFSPVIPAGFDDLAGLGTFDLILNATSASLYGVRLEIPDCVFGAGSLAYDLTYGKGLTPFLCQAKQAGVTRLHDGVGMLVEQAAEAFAWWRGVRPRTDDVIARMTVPL